MKILVRKLTENEITDYRISHWPVWTKEISEFDWYYDSIEDCLFLEGKVEVSTTDGQTTLIQAGDYVTFPKGLSCRWKVIEPVRKHYRFR